MNKIYLKINFVLLLSIFIISNLRAADCTALAPGGDWDSEIVWSCERVPANGDRIIIPAGIRVKINASTPEYSAMVIDVNGELEFGNGQKLNMNADGVVNVSATGFFSNGNAGSKVIIGGTELWTGPGPKLGPFVLSLGPLPVELLDFTAKLANSSVDFIWSTASEKNNSFFVLERSTNGMDFKPIAKINGAGNSNELKKYNASDKNPAEGNSYYRLKQTDFDGKFEYSSPLAINFDKLNSGGCILKVFPNPCIAQCTVDLSECKDSENQEIKVEVMDAFGNLVISKVPIRSGNGSFSFEIDTQNNLKPGIYIVNGVSKKEKYSQKIIVK